MARHITAHQTLPLTTPPSPAPYCLTQAHPNKSQESVSFFFFFFFLGESAGRLTDRLTMKKHKGNINECVGVFSTNL